MKIMARITSHDFTDDVRVTNVADIELREIPMVIIISKTMKQPDSILGEEIDVEFIENLLTQ